MDELTRRGFLEKGALSVGAVLASSMLDRQRQSVYGAVDENSKPAILGGEPVSTEPYLSWPQYDKQMEDLFLESLRTLHWCRISDPASCVPDFEKAFAEHCGAKYCIAVNSGTSSLITALAALDVGPGDEVITTPYTYRATVNTILTHYALPILADVDPKTFMIDPKSIEEHITPRTKAILPVHIGGAPANMDEILEIGKRHNIPVVEDACQAHFGRWRDKYLGTLGTFGCFSMQISKNISCGEGGAVFCDDVDLADKAFKIHTHCHGAISEDYMRFEDVMNRGYRSYNFRMTAFQAAILLAQLPTVEDRAKTRNENALYLAELLRDIPGVHPQVIYDGGTSAWHLFMFTINEEEFGCSRNAVFEAIRADEIAATTGCGSDQAEWVKYLTDLNSTPEARRIYSDEELKGLAERTQIPNNDYLCANAIWFFQNQFLAPRSNMDAMAASLRRIQKNAKAIAKALD